MRMKPLMVRIREFSHPFDFANSTSWDETPAMPITGATAQNESYRDAADDLFVELK